MRGAEEGNPGNLDFLDPVMVAREFINFEKVAKSRRQAILNGARTNSNFGASAFFTNFSHRRNSSRLQPWVKALNGSGVATLDRSQSLGKSKQSMERSSTMSSSQANNTHFSVLSST